MFQTIISIYIDRLPVIDSTLKQHFSPSMSLIKMENNFFIFNSYCFVVILIFLFSKVGCFLWSARSLGCLIINTIYIYIYNSFNT